LIGQLNFYHQSYSFLNPKQTIVKYNSEWFNRVNIKELILMCSSFSTFYILNRKDFHTRFCKNQSVFMHEILYPVLQGLDSLFIKSDIEMGGSDQLFNLITGRHIMKKYDLKPQSIITLPLIEGINGIYKYGKILGEKMSKSLSNYIPLTSIAIKDFNKIVGMCDEIMVKFYMCVCSYTNNKLLRMKNIYIYSQFLKYNLVYTLFSILGNVKRAQSSFADFHHLFMKNLKKISGTTKYYIRYTGAVNFIRFLAEHNYLTSVNLGKSLLKSSILLINNRSYSSKNVTNKHNFIITVTKRVSLWTYIY
jgi:tyrosyl-tRNA synthetase